MTPHDRPLSRWTCRDGHADAVKRGRAMSRWSGKARYLPLLLTGLGLLMMSLVSCASSGSPIDVGGSQGGVEGFKTPNPNLFTPTPRFPTFTIGAWPSNYTPQNNDTVIIYVLCRTQPPDMSG